MREIKFRAWDKANKQMSEVLQMEFRHGDLILAGNEEDWLEQPDFEVMQYTGLKDKNGVEIYEGDVVLLDDYPSESNPMGEPDMAVVEFLSGAFGMRYLSRYGMPMTHGGFDSFQSLIGDGDTLLEEKVIGNIYENPELKEEHAG